ncbi:GNAT family N-acetyltransferase [Roseomonas sp. CCTCC AB2023176]|uniref:GNAT family N-acetyltransferase n=1 Tax=Roseomonas sp. CCTCC AB2023176 TaxID=3342640 RepID=UPI0035DC5D6B
MDIRGAQPADATEIAALLSILGEPVTPREATLRLEGVAGGPAAALVATNWAGTVIGFVALSWGPSPLFGRPVARLTALVVEEAERGAGIGRLLVKAASQAARQAGCDAMEATAADPRFLEAIGFARSGEAMTRPLRKRQA